MTYFKCGDRVQTTKENELGQGVAGVVVGNGFLHSGVPCIILSIDVELRGVPRRFTERYVVPVSQVETLK